MTKHASGTFEVKMSPQAPEETVGDPTVGRMALDKELHGDLEASSKGQMLAYGTGAAASYVLAGGLLVVSLNMAGSVPDAADLVVTDPVQAGVMAVMAVADTAKFTIQRLNRRTF